MKGVQNYCLVVLGLSFWSLLPLFGKANSDLSHKQFRELDTASVQSFPISMNMRQELQLSRLQTANTKKKTKDKGADAEMPFPVGDETARIVGGEPMEEGRFPYMTALLYLDSQGDKVAGCGGSLIAPNIVLTAAHCGAPVEVLIGCYDLYTAVERRDEGCEVFQVDDVKVFPGYDGSTMTGDVQLIIIDGESQNKPVLLSGSVSAGFIVRPSYRLSVIGWGHTSYEGVSSSILLGTEVDVVDRQLCDNQYRFAYNEQQAVIDDTMLCAMQPGQDACQGDSGGPLLLRCDSSKEDVQVGLVSFGIGCAYPGFPGVYSNLGADEVHKFIEGVVQSEGHSFSVLSSFDEFCVVDGTRSPTLHKASPTLFPTFPLTWTCNFQFFGALDGCDCNCGFQDPDCEYANQELFNCEEEDNACVEGVCVISSTIPEPNKESKAMTIFIWLLGTTIVVLGVGLLRRRKKQPSTKSRPGGGKLAHRAPFKSSPGEFSV